MTKRASPKTPDSASVRASVRSSAYTRTVRSFDYTRTVREPNRIKMKESIVNKRTILNNLDEIRAKVNAIQLTKLSLLQPKIKLLRKIDDTVATIGYKTLLTKTQLDDTKFIINSLDDEFKDLTRENKSSGRFGGTKRKKWGRPPF